MARVLYIKSVQVRQASRLPGLPRLPGCGLPRAVGRPRSASARQGAGCHRCPTLPYRASVLALGPSAMMHRRAFVTGMTAASWAAAVGVLPTRASASDPIRLGFQVNIWGSLSVVALRLGIFEKVGLTVEGIQAPVGRQTRDAMVAGRIHFGTFAVPTFVLGAEKGDLTGVALAGNAGRTVHILVRPDSPYRSVADLRGKKIATGIGSSTDAVFQARVGPKFGLVAGSYESVNTLEPDKVAALIAKQVEASVSTEPFVSVAEEQGLARSIVSFEAFDPIPVVLAAGPGVVDKRRDATVQFLRAWVAAARIFLDEPKRAADVMVDVLTERGYTVAPSVVQKALGRFDFGVEMRPDFRAYAEAEAESLRRAGRIKVMPDWNRALRRDLLEQALKG
jgi:ABC-type nitrate/sulfonate/bicarbonate transport system substrate-binding protein